MALNKTTRDTPSSRSGYFTELTASAGKQTNLLLPFRIKMTPNKSTGPLSDGKKNPAKMLQPVLIKDLLQSTRKTKNDTSIASDLTRKEKPRPQKSSQPYLNTALNKTTRGTPSSRSGYFTELTASAGKQTNLLLPFRIKMTPNKSTGPLSDGKKNPAKMLQPVLIKDLLQSTRKTRNDTSIASVSTQKKKPRPQKSSQPYLNTQSCHKPEDNEVKQSTLFSRKSCGGNKVRRQLYQTLDSPQKSTTEEKTIVAKKKIRNVETTAAVEKKSNQSQNKIRKSLLLPPNSIKNTYLKKSVSNAKPNSKLNTIVRGTTAANKSDISRVSDARKSKVCVENDVSVNTEEEVDIELHLSSPEVDKIHSKQSSYYKKDNFTMTSPTIDCSELQNDNFISTINSISRYSSVTGPLCSEMQNLKINNRSHDVIDNTNGYKQTYQNNEHDFKKISNLDYNDFIQLKSFLEQSIKSCEDQASKFKQFLTFINNVHENSTSKTKDASLEENLRTENTFLSTISESSFITTEIYKRKENKVFANNEMEVKPDESKSPTEVSQKLPIPLRILVNDTDLNQDLKEISSETLIDNARLSTIGEVSCEADVSNKDDKESSEVKRRASDLSKIDESCSIECENFENKENCDLNTSSTIITRACTPKTPRSRRSLIPESCDSQGRRRSARLAAKRASLSMTLDSDKQDSFTMLENELNVVHPKVPSKSLPASPVMHPPMTPGIVKQWDKNMERPLREYMALKMNGTFLVTPDVKKFQSRLETTDTPHSRKSLSRKIFMELCDLYAESPEPK